MTVRRPRPATPRLRPATPAGPSFKTSTAGWYADWKARKAAPAGPAPGRVESAPPDATADALARWLTADVK